MGVLKLGTATYTTALGTNSLTAAWKVFKERVYDAFSGVKLNTDFMTI